MGAKIWDAGEGRRQTHLENAPLQDDEIVYTLVDGVESSYRVLHRFNAYPWGNSGICAVVDAGLVAKILRCCYIDVRLALRLCQHVCVSSPSP